MRDFRIFNIIIIFRSLSIVSYLFIFSNIKCTIYARLKYPNFIPEKNCNAFTYNKIKYNYLFLQFLLKTQWNIKKHTCGAFYRILLFFIEILWVCLYNFYEKTQYHYKIKLVGTTFTFFLSREFFIIYNNKKNRLLYVVNDCAKGI